jgi:hypothetical protein
MERCRMVFSGSGGQGVITAAIILAEAAVMHEGLTAVQTQAYGAAARGGATRTDVIISDTTINFPKVIQPNVLVCLTQESYNKFFDIIRPGRADDHGYPLRPDPAEGGRHPAGTAHVRDGHGSDRQAHRVQHLHAGCGDRHHPPGQTGVDHAGAGDPHPLGLSGHEPPGPGTSMFHFVGPNAPIAISFP